MHTVHACCHIRGVGRGGAV